MQYRGESSTSPARTQSTGYLNASLSNSPSYYQQTLSDQWSINSNPGPMDADMSSSTEDDMDTSTSNIPGYAAAHSAAIFPTVSMFNPQLYGLWPLDYAAYAMEEETSSSRVSNGSITPAPTVYMMPPAEKVLSMGSVATGQAAAISSGLSTTSENALTPIVPPQFEISTPDDFAQWEMTTSEEQVENYGNISPLPPRRPSRHGTLRTRRNSAKAAGHRPRRKATPSTPLPADLEAFKQILDAELGAAFWMAELGRMPLSGISTPLQPMSSGSVSDSMATSQKPLETSLFIVEDSFTADSGQLHTLPAPASNMQTDHGVAQQMSTFPALTSVSSGFPQAPAENATPPTPVSDESIWSPWNGGPTQYLQHSSTPTRASTEFSSSTTSPAATRPTRNKSLAIIAPSCFARPSTETNVLPSTSPSTISLSKGEHVSASPPLTTNNSGEEAVKVSPGPPTTLTVDQTSEKRPSSGTTPYKLDKLLNNTRTTPLPRQITVLRKDKWETMSVPRMLPSKNSTGSTSGTTSVGPSPSVDPLEKSHATTSSSRTVPCEPEKLPNKRRVASLPRRVPAPRKDERETLSIPQNPPPELIDRVKSPYVQTAAISVQSVSSADSPEKGHSTLTPPLSSADFLSPLDGLNPLPRPFSLPKFVKRIPLSPASVAQSLNNTSTAPRNSGLVPSRNPKAVSKDAPCASRHHAGDGHESIDDHSYNVLALPLPLNSGKLRSVLDLTANWEMHGLTIPWYAERTEQLTREVVKGIERCFYVTVELVQRFKHSLLKVDLLITQCGAMCDVLRELYRVAGETHKCRGGCKNWHKTHNKKLKKLQDRIDMCFVLVTTPISPSKRAKKTFHFLQKLDEWVKVLRTSSRTSMEISEAIKSQAIRRQATLMNPGCFPCKGRIRSNSTGDIRRDLWSQGSPIP